MFVQCFCRNRNDKEKDELYQVLGALANREQMQIEEVKDEVVIYACPQGTIRIKEEDDDVIIYANTRHAGPGFHAFVVEFCKDVQEELPGKYELIDDLDFDQDENFHRLHRLYEEEITYLKDVLNKNEDFRKQNYLYDETYFLPIEKENRIFTALGDMDQEEFMQMSEEDLLDIFYVWNTWEKDAQFYKNAALLLLAKEGVGEYSLMNDQTLKYANEICDYIEIAHHLDPTMTLPMVEYNKICDYLEREKKVSGISAMEQEVIQYRLQDVYHLFEDMKVVAPGTCERSYDPVSQSLCLMSPYKDISEWKWLIQASKQSIICAKLDELSKQEPISYKNKKIYLLEYQEDAYYLEAMVQQEDRVLYFHITVADPKDIPYLKQCMKESEFQKGL